MTLNEVIIEGGEFYDRIARGAIAFPYSSDLMHIGIIGFIPFLVGKYGSKLIGKAVPFFDRYSNLIGFLSAGISEVLWQGLIEPASPYDHPGDRVSDYKGIVETAGGAGLAFLVSKLFKSVNK